MKQKIGSYQIEASDSKNYTVSRISIAKKGANEGKEVETVIGYYSSIKFAVQEIARLCANEKDSLKQWLAEYREVIKTVESLLN